MDHEITEFLRSWQGGDEAALEKLTPLVYRELHRLAAKYMRGEQVDHTLQATALVNEAYVRLIDWKNVQWQNRGHFFGVAAQVMRRILVDYARSRRYDKRGGGVRPIPLDEAPPLQATISPSFSKSTPRSIVWPRLMRAALRLWNSGTSAG